jgi:hypothetical protein
LVRSELDVSHHSGDCVKRRPHAFHTLPPIPTKRPQHNSWGNLPSIGALHLFIMLIKGASLNYSKPMMSIPGNRAVIDLTESRSPTPDVRPTPVVMDSSGRDPRISISALGQSTQSNAG